MQKLPDSQRCADPMIVAVNALGITQITAWGTSYYCLGVLAKPIVADTGWPLTVVFLGFSVALLVMGFISTWVGRLIDCIGARIVMCLGTIVVSAGLVALSQVWDQTSYLVGWAVLGIGMRCCLYDAAFAALVQVTPTRGRKAISYLTLYGAYASTVFWVIGHYLNELYGWRGTLIAFAAINLVICLPLNWLGLARRDPPVDVQAQAAIPTSSPDGPALEGRMRIVGIALFAYALGPPSVGIVAEHLGLLAGGLEPGRELVDGFRRAPVVAVGEVGLQRDLDVSRRGDRLGR